MERKKLTSNYQGEGQRAKPKKRVKTYNKNGIPIIGSRKAREQQYVERYQTYRG